MSFKRTIPYVITSATLLFIGTHSLGSNESYSTSEPKEKNISNVRDIPTTVSNKDSIVALKDIKLVDEIAINAKAQRYDVVYTRADGNGFRRSGGTRAWRNNNPGCLRYSDFTIAQGAIGEAGGFAVFPNEEIGMKAIGTLLKSDKYRNLTISQAISKYAPPHENDTANYNAYLSKITGLSISKKLSELDDNQITKVVKAIRIVEGWRPGHETKVQINTTQKDSLDLYAAVQNKMLQKSFEKTL